MNTTTLPDSWVGLSEASRLLGVSLTRLNQMINAGQIGVLRTPLGRLASREDVERLAAARAARNRKGL